MKNSLTPCSDVRCGRIQCQGGNSRPLLGSNTEILTTTVHFNHTNIVCRGASFDLGNDVSDPAMVAEGTACGPGKVGARGTVTYEKPQIWLVCPQSVVHDRPIGSPMRHCNIRLGPISFRSAWVISVRTRPCWEWRPVAGNATVMGWGHRACWERQRWLAYITHNAIFFSPGLQQ